MRDKKSGQGRVNRRAGESRRTLARHKRYRQPWCRSAALTRVEQASYTCLETDCFDRTRIIPNDTDLADRLDSALDLIEAAIAARTAEAAAAAARLDALKAAAGEAVAALDVLIGDS